MLFTNLNKTYDICIIEVPINTMLVHLKQFFKVKWNMYVCNQKLIYVLFWGLSDLHVKCIKLYFHNSSPRRTY